MVKIDITVRDATSQQAREIIELMSVTIAPLPVAPTPPGAPSVEPDEGPAQPFVPGELDVSGLPWDERIHASTRAKTDTGNWRKRRGVQDALVTQIETELRSHAPTPPAAMFTPPSPPAPPPGMPRVPGATFSAPPAPPVAPVFDFAALMAAIQRGMQSNPPQIDVPFLNWMAQTLGISAVPDLATAENTHLVERARQLLVEQNRWIAP